MVDAKLAGQDEVRLRPPLAADAKKSAQAPKQPAKVPKPSGRAAKPQAQPAKQPPAATPAKGKQKGNVHAPSTTEAASKSTVGASTDADGWTTVVKKSKKPKTPAQHPKAGRKASKKRDMALRSPGSTSVIITLQPGAEERGLSYAAVLAEAKEKVPQVGITSVRYRKAASGARVFELPGAMSGEKADALAAKIREAFQAEDVRVSRPVKCADLRIKGLDDSVTTAEVVAAVAKAGGCAPSDVKAGEVRHSETGVGTIWVRCPVAAARKVTRGRLLVGWVSAQVKLLLDRPKRCFRCHKTGHIKPDCRESVDRSQECFRCGQTGHEAKQCSQQPHCTSCAAAGLDAGHSIGSRPCKSGLSKTVKGKGMKSAPQPTPVSTSAGSAGESVVPMAQD